MSQAAKTPPIYTPVSDSADLGRDRSLVRSIAWNSVAKSTSQALTWISTIAVARMLSPSDYGLVGMATVFTAFVAMLSEFGLGTAIVTLKDLDRRQIAQLNGLSMLIGIVACLISLAAAKPLGGFFVPEVVPIIAVLSVTFVIGALRVVPNALLQRELRFKLLSLIEAAQAVSLAVCTFALAWLGFGYWALVAALVGGSLFSSVATLFFRPHPFAWPRAAALGSVAKFGWQVLTTRIAWYAVASADFAVAGRVLGATPLGFYTVARTVASAPMEKLTSLVAGVTPAFFANVQSDHAALRRYLLLITEAIALVTFPVVLGLVLVAPEFVHVVLGSKWAVAILPMQLLALYAVVQSVVCLLPQLLFAIGQARVAMWLTIAMGVAFPIGFLVGSRWGITGIAAVWIILYPLFSFPMLLRVCSAIELPLRQYGRALWPAFSSTAIMVVIVQLGSEVLGFRELSATTLTAKVLLGAVAYATIFLTLHRSRVAQVRTALSYLRR